MEGDFWQRKWARGEIGFHQAQVNSALVEHWERLGLASDSRIFVPLCGKTVDIAWLLKQGHRVVGVELSSLAIQHLFLSLDLSPTITEVGTLSRFCAENLEIWVGDGGQMDWPTRRPGWRSGAKSRRSSA